jgi:TIR domain
MQTKDHRIFISHSESDTPLAEELCRHLKSLGAQVFLDTWLLPGDNWHLEIGKALEAADSMVVLISPAAARSVWVQQEILYALGSERFQDRLIPVEVEPTEDYPWVLRQLEWIKGEGDVAQVGKRIVGILHIVA